MKKKNNCTLTENTDLTLNSLNEIIPLEESLQSNSMEKKSGRRKKENIRADDYSEFPSLAQLMGISVEQLKDEFFLFQIKKLMSKMAKTVIRYGVSEKEMEKLFCNAKALEMDEIVVAPAFLPACVRQVKKLGDEGFKVGAIIDFPFGESTYKSKISGMKDCIKLGVDDITVMMPSMLVCKENIKEFRKQSAKIGKMYRGFAGIALNASDLNEEQIELAIKSINRTKLAFLTFVFGSASIDEVKLKMNIVNKYKDKKVIFALANVDSAEGIMTLFSNGVDKILTPFADKIGEELIKKFKIKSVKLK